MIEQLSQLVTSGWKALNSEGDVRSAEGFFSDAVNQAKIIQKSNPDQAADVFLSNGIFQGTQGRFELMKQGALEALEIYRKLENKHDEVQSLEVLAFAEGLLGNREEQLSVLDSTVQLASEIGDTFNLARALSEQAHAFATRHQLDRAEQSFREAKEVLSQLPTHQKEIAEWRYAMYFAKMSVQKFEDSGDRAFLEVARENVTRMQELTGQDAIAERAHLSMTRGFVEGMAGNLEKSRADFDEARGLFGRVNAPLGIAEVNYYDAYVSLKSGNADEGFALLSQAEQTFRELGAKGSISLVDELRKETST